MTIENVNYRRGIPYNEDNLPGIIKNSRSKARPLFEGKYNLTPKPWTKRSTKHELNVRDDGSGTYSITSLDHEVVVTETKEGELVKFKPDVITVELKEEEQAAIITDFLEDQTLGIYRIIFHKPGPTPKRPPFLAVLKNIKSAILKPFEKNG